MAALPAADRRLVGTDALMAIPRERANASPLLPLNAIESRTVSR